MTEFTILTANDIHISDVNPRSRLDNFKESILEKIEQIRTASIKLKADAFIIAGDLFNIKNPARNSHELNRELTDLFRSFKCPVFMIPGNHDMTGNNLESLKKQPLGVLFASETLINLTENQITKKGKKISLIGVPYTEDLDLNSVKIPPKDDLIQICVMHLYAGPKAGMLYRERLYGYDELSALSPDIFILGHYHVNQGIQEINGKHFINLGSISRGTSADESIEHQPQFGVIKIIENEGSISIQTMAMPLTVKPAAEVFDLKKREEEKKQETEIQKFVDHLTSMSSMGTDPEKDFEKVLDSMNLAKVIRDKVLHYIHEAAAVK